MPPQQSSRRSSGVLVPTPIVDINGVQTSRNKRVETIPSAASEARLQGISAVPARPQSARIDGWSSRVSAELRDAIDSSYNKAHILAQRRPLPYGMTISSAVEESTDYDGSPLAMYTVRIEAAIDGSGASGEVGRIDWNGTTGFVDWFESPPHLVAHLMSLAKTVTDDADDAPPLFADEMSLDGYRITKHHLPELLDENPVVVEGVPLLSDEHFGSIRKAIDEIADLDVNDDELRDVADVARITLSDVRQSHDAYFSEKGAESDNRRSYFDAQVAAEDALDEVIAYAESSDVSDDTVRNLYWYRRSLSYGLRIDEGDDDDY